MSFAHDSDNDIIPDPYYGGAVGFKLVYQLLEQACNGLLTHLSQPPTDKLANRILSR